MASQCPACRGPAYIGLRIVECASKRCPLHPLVRDTDERARRRLAQLWEVWDQVQDDPPARRAVERAVDEILTRSPDRTAPRD